MANNENLVIVTNDKDFGEIVFRQKSVSIGIILIRVKSQDVRKTSDQRHKTDRGTYT